MAKIRIHELAKELGFEQSKEILAYLKSQGIEKSASSSVEDDVANAVRKALSKNQTPEKTMKNTKEEVQPVKEEEKKVSAESKAKADTAPAAEAAREAMPKKKKTIIFVGNAGNSQGNRPGMGGRPGGNGNRPAGNAGRPAGNGNGRPVGANPSRPGANGGKGAAAAKPAPRTPIKPLTPPSPTPSVQMVSSKPQPKPRTEAPEIEKKQAVPVETPAEVKTPAATVSETPVTETLAEKPAAPKAERPAASDRPQTERSNDRPQSDRGPRGDRPAYQGDRNGDRSGRPSGDRTGRPAGDRSFGDRGPRGDRPAYQGDRNGDRSGRPSGDRNGRPAGDRNFGDRNANRGDRPGFGGRSGRPGEGKDFGGKDFGGKDFGGRPGQGQGNRGFNGASRDGRGGQAGFGRDKNQGGKSFGGDAAPVKDLEKKREEDKRRASSAEKSKKSKKDHIYEEDAALQNKPGRFIKPEKKKEEVVEEQIKVITLPDTITIKDLADKMRLQPAAIIKKLFLAGKIVTVNQEISYEDAENIAMENEILCEKEVKVDVIEELLKEDEEAEENLVERPPVICVMGHVDHGKTSLLDAIRKTNVTDREAGGITQHIGAYTVAIDGRKITFLDTPGHEAFTAMRMRGANSTDIAILVVAADDGVMPQTVEAINHAKAAGIEIVVAVNKIDKPAANIERVKQELTEYELVATDWGGTTEFVPVSAKSGEGIEDLLETILLTADILELKANPNRRARGLVIEAELDKGRGPVATVLVQKGTLHVGDFVSAGACYGKVRAMIDDKGRRVKEAGPSTPVEILGLSDVPSAGEVFLAHENDKTAKSYAETYMAENKEKKLEETKTKMSLDDLYAQIKEGNLKELNLIVKADVQGSVEAVKQSLLKLSNEEIVVKCIHGGVGAINESDVTLASASNAIIIGFNVRPDATAKATAEQEGVDVRLYRVIYQAIEDIEAAMKGMLDPVFEEKVIGHAIVRQVFKASQVGNIVGSYVMDGILQRNCKVRITREGEQIYEGALASLKRFKDDVKEVKEGFECGLVFEGFDAIKEDDMIEAYIMVEVPR